MKIYCCQCQIDVLARLTNGIEIYPHRDDLFDLPFWICDVCLNYVGCHHKTKNKTNPLGVIPNKQIKEARQHIHKILDPLWNIIANGKKCKYNRGQVYAKISSILGYNYHTAEIKTIEEARKIYSIIQTL